MQAFRCSSYIAAFLCATLGPATPANAQASTIAGGFWAAGIVFVMLTAVIVVTGVVAPSPRRRDEYTRCDPNHGDFLGGVDTDAKPQKKRCK